MATSRTPASVLGAPGRSAPCEWVTAPADPQPPAFEVDVLAAQLGDLPESSPHHDAKTAPAVPGGHGVGDGASSARVAGRIGGPPALPGAPDAARVGGEEGVGRPRWPGWL